MPPAVWLALAGLVIALAVHAVTVAYQMGKLVQRVSTVERSSEDRGELSDKVTRLQVEMEHANAALLKVGREMEGVNRQLGNIAMGRVGQSTEFGGKP